MYAAFICLKNMEVVSKISGLSQIDDILKHEVVI